MPSLANQARCSISLIIDNICIFKYRFMCMDMN